MSYTPIPSLYQAAINQSNAQYNQYHQALAQQNLHTGQYANYYGINTTSATGTYVSTGANVSSAAAIGAPIYGNISATYTHYQLPNPTGNQTQIVLVDANGIGIPITVDTAYVPIIMQIICYHQMNQPMRGPASPPVKMVDGDFSLDEIDQAEQIMEELREAV
jgi:hypothetical protein